MINELQRFMVTVDEGSVTRAAKKLHLTQPALSTSLQKLEKKLNTQLFTIKQRQLIITDSGKNLYRVAKKINELWNNAKHNLNKEPSKEQINVGLFDNAALRLAGFLQKQQYNVTIDRSANLAKDLTYGLIDIAVVVKNPEEVAHNLTIAGQTSEKLVPVGNHIYDINLKQIPFLLYNEGSQTRKYIDATFFAKGIKPTIAASSSSTTFMKELAMQGGGVALLPENFVKHELQSKKLFAQKLPITFFRTMAVVTQKDASQEVTKQAELIVKKIMQL